MDARDGAHITEHGHVAAAYDVQDAILYRVRVQVAKREGDWTGDQILAGLAPAPYEVLEFDGNLLVYGGASAIWARLIGTGITAFDNTNAHLGVGDSATAAAAGQTDLQAATNKLRKVMDATYPQHTDGVVVGSASIVFRATFGAGDANFAWNEWCLANAVSGGRMFNRKVEVMGSKSGGTWTLTATFSAA